jgi:acyl-CoA hydrolase/RimJ/RimL family protein N-acetyltransferase
MKTADYTAKRIEPDQALDLIKPGDRIFLSSGPAIPARMAMEITRSKKQNLQDLEIIHLITLGDYLSAGEGHAANYRLKTFNVGESIGKAIGEGNVDFIPATLLEIPQLLSTGIVGMDVAIVQASPPDGRGFMNLGVAVDVANIAIKNAPVVIAEINPNVPVTYGETTFHIDQVGHVVESDVPLLERETRPYDRDMDRIGWHISNIVDDGSTVALHAGRIFDAIAHHLRTKKDLGVYTHVISDWVIDLVESGAVSLDRSRVHGGQITTSYCYGTRRLYDFVDRNPVFEFYPIARLLNPFVLQRLDRLVSIMNVKKIDLTGESVIFHSGDNLLSGYEGKLNLAVGAAFSKRGKTIVALKSTGPDGSSNIVIRHGKKAEQERATLGVMRYVVTEYGVANIFGKSIRERVLALIDIARPDHRQSLLEQAKRSGYAYPDQIYTCLDSCKFPSEIETIKTFKEGLEVRFRPIRPSDEDMMRRLFYDFSDDAKYLRYFAKIATMPHREMQKYVNIDYESILSIVGVITRDRTERIIAEARYARDPEGDSYETAFIVDEEFQGRGIAAFMLDYLINIATERGIKALSATVLPHNSRMLRVFGKARIKPETKTEDGLIELKFVL